MHGEQRQQEVSAVWINWKNAHERLSTLAMSGANLTLAEAADLLVLSVVRTGFHGGAWPTADFIRLNSILGLAGEAAEVSQKTGSRGGDTKDDLAGEIGDVLWYAGYFLLAEATPEQASEAIHALIGNRRDPAPSTTEGLTTALMEEAGYLCDLLKKDICHGVPEMRARMPAVVDRIVDMAADLCMLCGLDMAAVVAQNHRKLVARYPGGFSTTDARRGDVPSSVGPPR